MEPPMSSRSSKSCHQKRGSTSTSRSRPSTTDTTATKDTKGSRPKDLNYQQKLIDAGVLRYGYKYPDGRRLPLPLNWKEITQRLAQPRPLLSPSAFPEEEYEEFVRADAEAFNEDDVKASVLPAMLKAMGASEGAQKNVLFTNIDPITDNITQAKPDYYYGAQPEQLSHNVRIQLSKQLIPSNHSHLPAVPNYFLEAKGPDGSLAVAQRQTLHNGAIGARAIQSLQSYGQDEPIFDNNAYAISSIYHGGTLKMYGHSSAQPNGPGTRPEYYMHQIRSFAMTDTVDSFRQGATTYKNAIDLTREHRNTAIVHANEMVAQTIEDGDEDEDESNEETENEEKHTDDDEVEAESSNTTFSIDCETSPVLNIAVQDEDEDEDEDEIETSSDDDSERRPPAKRSLPMSHRSQRQRVTGKPSHLPQKSITPDAGRDKQRSWFKWL
ncbi:MAG: hypothetical protein Q9160_005573 [Pyrenula sp. 1 TL-2023]